mmetsp:Transcript_24346/g.37683  ORF Transcript_24346/g.37683 Transcript_24346/m.37683 type:complete len:105 (+) Transcript_24346:2841-3155(+)
MLQQNNDIHELADDEEEGSADGSDSRKSKSKKMIWNQDSKMLIPQDYNDWLQTSSMNSGGTMTQEMIDLVDNLIDASPRSRAEIYEKSQHIKKKKSKKDFEGES